MGEREYAELDRLSRSADEKDRKKVAQDTDTPADILDRLSRDESDDVRAWVAQHRSTPPSTLWRLYEEKGELVRWRLARNAEAPAELLVLLCKDEDEKVRQRLPGNRALPQEGLAILAADDVDHPLWGNQIRIGVAKHRNVGTTTLLLLMTDSDQEVKATAIDKLNLEKTPTADLEMFVRVVHEIPSDVDLSLFPREVLLKYLT